MFTLVTNVGSVPSICPATVAPKLISPCCSLNILDIILVVTPKRFTLAGGVKYIGVLNCRLATSISLSTPTGIYLELNVIPSIFTTVKLVQSK